MKVKETVKKMGEKTKKFYEENKVFVGYCIGITATTVLYSIWENPKKGRFSIGHCLDAVDSGGKDIKIRVEEKNRFGAICRSVDHFISMETAERMADLLTNHVNQRNEILEGKEN